MTTVISDTLVAGEGEMISILVMTLNEETNLPGCLDTVRWSDDIHVFDSYSSDRTAEIAQEYGAKVWFRKFDNYAQHQNWALKNITFKYPWVFYFDADERVTPNLAAAMQRAVQEPSDNVAFRVRRRDFFLDTWLKHVQMTAFYERLFRPDKMHYERLVNPVSVPDGPVGTVEGYLDHYPFSKGITGWVERHNSYSTNEAMQILADSAGAKPFDLRGVLFERDPNERRRNMKRLYYRMPFRPLVKFIIMYFLKRGFLDGAAGFTYTALVAYYETLISFKTDELRRRARIAASP
jgi:glycosyltransferase involved in cell wall biosynthesis